MYLGLHSPLRHQQNPRSQPWGALLVWEFLAAQMSQVPVQVPGPGSNGHLERMAASPPTPSQLRSHAWALIAEARSEPRLTGARGAIREVVTGGVSAPEPRCVRSWGVDLHSLGVRCLGLVGNPVEEGPWTIRLRGMLLRQSPGSCSIVFDTIAWQNLPA